MEVELSGSRTAKENAGGTMACHKPELCKVGCVSLGREAQVQTLDFNFLEVKLKGLLLPISSQAECFFLPYGRLQFYAYQPRSYSQENHE